jgi:hypothetical protein
MKSFFRKQTSRLNDDAMVVLSEIGSWYIYEHYTYIRIYGSTNHPHLLTKFVLNRLIIREIVY